MTKFKILKWALLLFTIANLISIILGIYLILYYNTEIQDTELRAGVIRANSYNIILTLIFTFGLYFIYRSCVMFISRGYFNSKSALYLKRGGYILAISAILDFIRTLPKLIIFLTAEKKPKVDSIHINSSITLVIIGFALVAASDIIKKGNKIKQENDLTI